jgi:Fe-S cluster biogenesis protein NfuA
MLEQTQVQTALAEVSGLVQADGGDIELVSVDPGAGAVALRLVVEGASCQECILPRPMLEDIAKNIMQRSVPEIVSVSIDDPREHPDYVPNAH